MKFISYFFFYTYVGLVAIAGAWGAFGDPRLDFRLLFQIEVDTILSTSDISLISQYRFLRALELGYGLFSLMFIKEIFAVRKFNYLFLAIMLMGVLARVVSFFSEGSPLPLFYFFAIYELIGTVFIFLYSRQIIQKNETRQLSSI